MQLALIHRAPGVAPPPAGAVLWRTCLRDVEFVDDGVGGGRDGSVVAGRDAYALLLEIVSGLRSPLVGETEVQAQFKAFLAALDPARHAGLLRVGQRVLADAKTIRHRHLQGFGAHSYGHLAVARLPDDATRIVVIGTGALAAEILAALGSARPIDQWGRRVGQETASAPHVTLRLFSDAARKDVCIDPVALAIAAPVGARDLAAVAARYARIAGLVDLRAADERAAAGTGAAPALSVVPTVTLDDLFADAPPADARSAARVNAARADVETLARAYDRREELRPFGWDDLCA